jgi:hypothetical protein
MIWYTGKNADWFGCMQTYVNNLRLFKYMTEINKVILHIPFNLYHNGFYYLFYELAYFE